MYHISDGKKNGIQDEKENFGEPPRPNLTLDISTISNSDTSIVEKSVTENNTEGRSISTVTNNQANSAPSEESKYFFGANSSGKIPFLEHLTDSQDSDCKELSDRTQEKLDDKPSNDNQIPGHISGEHFEENSVDSNRSDTRNIERVTDFVPQDSEKSSSMDIEENTTNTNDSMAVPSSNSNSPYIPTASSTMPSGTNFIRPSTTFLGTDEEKYENLDDRLASLAKASEVLHSMQAQEVSKYAPEADFRDEDDDEMETERQDLDARIAAIINGTADGDSRDEDDADADQPYDPANPTDSQEDSHTEEMDHDSDSEPIMDDDELHNLLGV
ncbi:hypothetical protein CHS0354_005489 [Potamilus streckersoni]|uniref:Uncharacterized protein n=1 Tax=Potamilus streckersoni TaxID=2493646 RepID=A0AAE0VUF4_9BIVA|nr:hypothetical protein CHS0354_005489 [Potamilus streckersoni]